MLTFMSWYSLVHHTWLNVCGLCALTGCHWWVLNRMTMPLVFCEGKLITESTIAPCGLSCLLLSVGEPQPPMKCIAKGCASRGWISMNTELCRLQVAWAEHLSMVSELELNVTPASTIQGRNKCFSDSSGLLSSESLAAAAPSGFRTGQWETSLYSLPKTSY